jgi:hypothetical protein
MWEDVAEMQKDQKSVKFKVLFFGFCSTMLFISIVLTITTSPGHIPEDSEWDMPEVEESMEQQEPETHGIEDEHKSEGSSAGSKNNK